MKQSKQGKSAATIALIAFALIALGVQWVQAQDFKINTRPLTPQEITDYGLPSSTQVASGNPVVGIGQPVYLEMMVEPGTVVTQAVWSLVSVVDDLGDPISSSAVITNSPLGLDIPSFDYGYSTNYGRDPYDVIDRAVIVPDVRGTYSISAQAMTADATLNASIEVVGSVFLGKDYTACTLCHASKQDLFNATGHATALTRKINDPGGHFNPNCISCHSLGYDKTPGAVNGGFDDVADSLGWTFPPTLGTNNWDEMPLALQQKSNVQCENCHGPAQEHLRTGGDTSKIAVSVSAGNCSQCHDKKSHHIKSFQWRQTLHAKGYVFRSGSCAQCHSTVGYIDTNDPGINEFGEVVATHGTYEEGITCAACHDPHGTEGTVHQTRAIDSITLANGTEITGGGPGRVCMACHHDRYEAEARAAQGRTPHHGTQTDLLFGENAIEYGRDMPSSKHGTVVEETCVQCHMQETPADLPAYAKDLVGGHTFTLVYDDGTNAPVHLTETCTSCHGEIEDFNFGGEDYDLDGMVEGVQSEVADMMAELGALVAAAPSGQRKNKANYNLAMVTDDGSFGVHNPKYIAAILRSSIDDLKGGIDIDKDGLVDEWEIAHFGNLTSQSGSDDFDGDGLSNAQEQNLGTDPLLIDTDGDGISDLVEVQAGSDPLDIDSVPTSDMLIMDAVEVGYLPQATGTVVQIQKIDSLTSGEWQSVGPAQTNTGAWVFQLDSTRGSSSSFYRAIEE